MPFGLRHLFSRIPGFSLHIRSLCKWHLLSHSSENTIQNVIEDAIRKSTGYEVKIQGSGRTDAGVHARGQVASLRLSGKVEEREFLRKLNEGLPEDIRIRSMELVPNTFHGRRSAKGKCYEYHVDLREKQQVFS